MGQCPFGSAHNENSRCLNRLRGLESKPFPSRNFRLSQAKTAEAFSIPNAVLNRFRRRTFHALNWRYLVRLMKRSASELASEWTTKEPTIGRTRRKMKENFLPLLLFFSLSYVSQEESVLRTDFSKNRCRWLLLRAWSARRGHLWSPRG